MKFGFIGAGKVGFSLGKYLADNNQNVVGYYSIINEEAIEAAKFTGSKYYENMEQLVEDSEVLFLTVPDGQIENLWNQLKSSHKNWMAKYNKPLLNNKIIKFLRINLFTHFQQAVFQHFDLFCLFCKFLFSAFFFLRNIFQIFFR